MAELKKGDHVQVFNGKHEKDYGRVDKILDDGSADIEFDYSRIVNFPIENVRKEKL